MKIRQNSATQNSTIQAAQQENSFLGHLKIVDRALNNAIDHAIKKKWLSETGSMCPITMLQDVKYRVFQKFIYTFRAATLCGALDPLTRRFFTYGYIKNNV